MFTIDPCEIHRCSEVNQYTPYVDDLGFICNYYNRKEK